MNKKAELFLKKAFKRYQESIERIDKKYDPFKDRDDDFMDRHRAYVSKYEFEQMQKYVEEEARKKKWFPIKNENKYNLTSEEVEKLRSMTPKEKKSFLKERE